MNKITAEEARKNQQDYIEANREAIERPARECLDSIYKCIESASKLGKHFVTWSSIKYSRIAIADRYHESPINLSKFIISELQSKGYTVTLDDEADLRISW